MNELTYIRCGDYYIPDLKTGGTHRQVWPYAAMLSKETPAQPLQQPDFE